MTKRAKKGSNQKRKASGKPLKKQTSVKADQPSTSIQGQEEAIAELPPQTTETAGIVSQTAEDRARHRPLLPLPAEADTCGETTRLHAHQRKPSGLVSKKCERLKKLAADIHQKCINASRQKDPTLEAVPPKDSVEELECLVGEIKRLADSVGFDLAQPPIPLRFTGPCDPIVFYEECIFVWPKTKMRVPAVFLHSPVDFRYHVQDILSRNIQMYRPQVGTHSTKILCVTFEDREKLLKYLDEKEVPYHTFGHPANKMMKVIIRGIANDVDLGKVRDEMIAAAIPVVRFHELNAKLNRKGKYKSIAVIVPNTEEAKKVLKIKAIFGQYVRVESPLTKSDQCHRCQKWGHTQRYCQGRVKCVKCAQDHWSKDCPRDRNKDGVPLRCANCAGEHPANYRRCPYCPDSPKYKEAQSKKSQKRLPCEILTLENLTLAD